MSLVGPRPLIRKRPPVTGHYAERLQHATGNDRPWQTSGRSEIGFGDMVKLDYTYVMN